MKEKTNRLTMKQQMVFGDLVRAEYTKSHMDDTEFAKFAAEKLEFELSRQQVANMREALEIPNNLRVSNGRASPIAQLERRVKNLEDRLDVYIQGCRK